MKERLQKAIEEVRNNAKCKKIMIMSSNKGVLKKIDGMNLDNVKIFPTELLSNNYKGLFDNDKIYILPDFKEEPVYLDWND